MFYDFNTEVKRAGSDCEKWDKENIRKLCGNPEAIPFWVADMDLQTSDAIHKAMKEEADFGVAGYRDYSLLKDDFISFASRRHSWNINGKDVLFAQGMLHAIALAMQLFSSKGDEVVVLLPAYRPFINMVEMQERKLVPYHFDYKDGAFSFNLEKFREVSANAKVILFCSPQNPTGIVFSQEELKGLLSLAKERNQLVLCDEIHADLVHPSAHHIPMGKANESIGAECITFMAPSKTFNIAGEHCAFAHFSHEKMKETFETQQKALFLTSPGYFIGAMAKAAYTESDEHNRELSTYLEENVHFINSYLEENLPELKLSNAEASFVAFLDCTKILDKVQKDAEKHPELYDEDRNLLSHFFGQRACICMNDGTWFGDEYKGFVRFNYGTSRKMVKEALECMKRAIESL